jgi:hypothetical protein
LKLEAQLEVLTNVSRIINKITTLIIEILLKHWKYRWVLKITINSRDMSRASPAQEHGIDMQFGGMGQDQGFERKSV